MELNVKAAVMVASPGMMPGVMADLSGGIPERRAPDGDVTTLRYRFVIDATTARTARRPNADFET